MSPRIQHKQPGFSSLLTSQEILDLSDRLDGGGVCHPFEKD